MLKKTFVATFALVAALGLAGCAPDANTDQPEGANAPDVAPAAAEQYYLPVQASADCMTCHGADGYDNGMPADHADRTSDMCQSCHVEWTDPAAQDAAGAPIIHIVNE